ncbi:hypothetical protein QT970_08265 [Microcoleus sp. herbarium8]|uniref:hypothetical protein n=1 Tax=Microcoleus sp. herbarium8 TaxID=3055436 RepID=UPI002FD6C053
MKRAIGPGAYLKKRAIYFTIERASAILEKSMNKKVSGYLKSQLLPTVIYCWNVGGRIPDLNQPHWSVDIDSNPSSIYREYMNKFARSYHGFTYDEAEKWLSETLIKLDSNQ